MASQDWSIKIVSCDGSVNVGFEPDVPGCKVGQPLQAGDADLISWNNRTGDAHWPWAIDPTTNEPYTTAAAAQAANMYLSDEVPAWQPSSPAYCTTAPSTGSTTINYICKLHPDETGQIVVTAGA